MKKGVYIVCAGLLAFIIVVGGIWLSAKNYSTVSATSRQNSIVGKWVDNSNPNNVVHYIFTENGFFGRLERVTAHDGWIRHHHNTAEYSTVGNNLIFACYEPAIREFNISGNSLTLTWGHYWNVRPGESPERSLTLTRVN